MKTLNVIGRNNVMEVKIIDISNGEVFEHLTLPEIVNSDIYLYNGGLMNMPRNEPPENELHLLSLIKIENQWTYAVSGWEPKINHNNERKLVAYEYGVSTKSWATELEARKVGCASMNNPENRTPYYFFQLRVNRELEEERATKNGITKMGVAPLHHMNLGPYGR